MDDMTLHDMTLAILGQVLMEEGWKIHALTSGFLSASGRGKYRRQCRITIVAGEDITVSYTKGKEAGTIRVPRGEDLVMRMADIALT